MDIKQIYKGLKLSRDQLANELFSKRLLENSISEIKNHLEEMEFEFINNQKSAANDVLLKIKYQNYYQSHITRKCAIEMELQSRLKEVLIVQEKIRELSNESQKYERLVKIHNQKHKLEKTSRQLISGSSKNPENN